MKIQCQFIKSLDQIDKDDWNCLISKDFPFLRYEFLDALEKSKSVSRASGWEPYHCIIFDQERVIAVVPQYLKHHSYGEYVFDWAWADAYHQHQLSYYPKLLSAIPFTPCVGPRLVIAEDQNTDQLKSAYVQACIQECESLGLSSWHLLFPNDEQPYPDMHKRVGVQFHWYNQDYQSFDDFLGALSSRKRKNLRKEREKVQSQELVFEWLEGPDISTDVLEAFYYCYQATYFKKGQKGYLTKEFFELVLEAMPESMCLLIIKSQQSSDLSSPLNLKLPSGIVACALFFKGEQTLYGRYWGCLQEYEHLHFEACYYQGIEYCIEHNFTHFDAGAQGEHKVLRGFRPIDTCSYHWLAHPEFSAAIADFLDRERVHVDAYKQETQALLPYKK